MKELFVELTSEELDDCLSMAHSPSGKNAAVCGNCQSSCFCKAVDGVKITIEDLL